MKEDESGEIGRWVILDCSLPIKRSTTQIHPMVSTPAVAVYWHGIKHRTEQPDVRVAAFQQRRWQLMFHRSSAAPNMAIDQMLILRLQNVSSRAARWHQGVDRLFAASVLDIYTPSATSWGLECAQSLKTATWSCDLFFPSSSVMY